MPNRDGRGASDCFASQKYTILLPKRRVVGDHRRREMTMIPTGRVSYHRYFLSFRSLDGMMS